MWAKTLVVSLDKNDFWSVLFLRLLLAAVLEYIRTKIQADDTKLKGTTSKHLSSSATKIYRRSVSVKSDAPTRFCGRLTL